MVTDFVGRVQELKAIDRLVDQRSRGVVLVGPAGIGKSRLAGVVAAEMAKHGARVIHAVGSQTAAGIPFSAVADWIPEHRTGEAPLDILLSTQRAILSSASGKRVVLWVDDAHLVDTSSATLLARLAASDAVFVMLAVEEGAHLPEAIRAMVKDDRVSTLRLNPLSREETGLLVAAELGAPMEALSLACLWGLSEGSPLYVRELIAEADKRAILVSREGLWSLSAEPPIGERLEAIVRSRLKSLTEAETAVLELVAIANPIGFDILDALADDGAVESLEAAGLITVGREGRRSVLRVTSPLVAAAHRAWMPSSRIRRLSGMLAAAREKLGNRRIEDRLDIARWRLASGRTSNPRVLVEGARVALAGFDSALGEELARKAVESGGGFDAKLELIRALALQRRSTEAGVLLEEITSQAHTEAELARTTLERIRNLTQLQIDPGTGLRFGIDALNRIEHAEWKDEVSSQLALYAAHIGDYPAALSLATEVVDRSASNPLVAVRRLLASSISHVMIGELAQGNESAHDGLSIALEVTQDMPLAADLFRMHAQHAAVSSGSIALAVSATQDGYHRAVDARALGAVGLWAAHSAFALLLHGNIGEAVNMYGEAVTHLQDLDPLGVLAVTQCWRPYAIAQTGDGARCEQLLGEMTQHYTSAEPRVRVMMDRASAWVAALSHDTELAARKAIEAGEYLTENSHVVWGLLTIHDAVRLGHPDLAVAPLEEHALHAEGALLPVLARHARALTDGDGRALDTCAVDLEHIGTRLLAAEAAQQAANCHSLNGDHALAARSASVARALAMQAPGARTPALRGRVRFLTDREFEVAVAAAHGHTNSELADRLHISRRTVENHLGSVYAKLGIEGRTELAAILAAASASGF